MPTIDLRFLAIFTNDFRFFSISLSIIDFLKFNGYRLYRYMKIWLLIIRVKSLVSHSFFTPIFRNHPQCKPLSMKMRFFFTILHIESWSISFLLHTCRIIYSEIHKHIFMAALLQVEGHQTSLSLCPSLFHFDETVHNFNSS